MHPRLQRQVRILDRWEAEFLAAVRKLLRARVDALEPVVKAALEPGGEKVVEKLGRLRALPGDYLPLLERYVGHLLVEGMVQGRSDVEFLRARLKGRGVRLASRVDGEPVVPEDAIDYIRHRRDLGRFFEQDQVDTVRTILDNGLKEGANVKQVMDALQAALPDAIGKARAENIARTEATTAFNQGRLAAFREAKGFVSAVEFMAITDARTTPICMERDGLVLALNDPALPANTPPLHYMCRSVLSPVSEFELEDLGGQAYLDRQRDKLDKLPAPLKGFGNEPGLEDGRPPGQPPVVRTPRGLKGGDEGGATEPTRQAITVDAFPGDGGRIWTPASGNRDRRPSGLIVVKDPAIPDEHPVVRQILDSIGGLPDRVQMVLSTRGVQIHFTEASGFGPKPAGTPDDEWAAVVRLVMGKGAAVLTGFPGPDKISQVFITDILGMGTRNLPRVARHETGHAVYRALGLESDPDIEKAFVLESPRLRKSFQRSKSEFVAEGFDQYYSGWVARQRLWFSARKLHGIIGGKMIELRGQEAKVLYQGAEGVVVGGGTGDNLCFTLDVGYGVEMADIWPDGTMISYGGGEKKFSTITVAWPEEKVWTPEEAEPYKAFLRSKGVTLPHVMS